MIDLIVASLVVFAITLVITKSSLLETKRDFVQNRYEASFVGGEKPNIIHWWWWKMWTCPMCLGFWASLGVAACYTTGYGYFESVLALFSLNWLLHCAEDALFRIGQHYEKVSKK